MQNTIIMYLKKRTEDIKEKKTLYCKQKVNT